jgi:hypothetical protein
MILIRINLFILFTFLSFSIFSQDRPSEARFSDMGSNLWIGSYNKFRIADKWIWDAQHHYRRGGYNNVAFIGKMDQIYNRHALTYLLNDKVNITFGGVLRLDFSPEPENPDLKNVVLEPRFWHEYLFIMPFNRFMLYHRVRIEHRWSRTNVMDSEYIFRNRWRYKIYANVPINKPRLVPGAFYFTPDVEIIMQSGKSVIDSPLEDLRIYPQIGYIVNPRVKIGGGPMYTMGQSLSAGYNYRQRWVIRANCYLSLDFRKFDKKIPEIKIRD